LNIKKSKGREDKFPLIGYDYQLRDVEDLYIAGGASHGPDFRKSAGGFIHGFRYTGEEMTGWGHFQEALFTRCDCYLSVRISKQKRYHPNAKCF
jgi:hypothetical protein